MSMTVTMTSGSLAAVERHIREVLDRAIDAARTSADLLRAGEHAADLQSVHTDAAERVQYALAQLIDLRAGLWGVDGTAAVVTPIIIGPIEPESGVTRQSWLEEQGRVAPTSPFSVDDLIERATNPDAEAAEAAVLRAQALDPNYVPAPALPFVAFDDAALTEDERRAIAAEVLSIGPIAADDEPRVGVFVPEDAVADTALPQTDRPWPCSECERDDFAEWRNLVGHMRGAHDQFLTKEEYTERVASRRTPGASPSSPD